MKSGFMSCLVASMLAYPIAAAEIHAPAVGAHATPSCAYVGTASSDGCASSQPGATTRYANFFTGYAAQSGQAKYRTRPPWNVAGVDYPVGYYTPLARLKDIRQAHLKGCDLKVLGGSQVLWCTGSGDLLISGYRFDLAGGTWLFLEGSRVHVYRRE